MFSRRRKQQSGPREVTAETDATLAGAGVLASAAFKIDPFMGYVVHEGTGYSAMLETNGHLTIYAPQGASAEFDLRTVRPGAWTQLNHGGHRLPLEVFLQRGDVVARWVFPEEHPSDAPPDVSGQEYARTGTANFWKPKSDADRAKDARLMDDLARTRTNTAMQQISSIR